MNIILRSHFLILAALIAAGWFVPRVGEDPSRRIQRAFGGFACRRTLAVLSLMALVVIVRLSLLPVIPIPKPGVHDEFSYLFAGDTFAHGRLANPTHPLWVFFETFHILSQPTNSSLYPPAQGGFLAVGQLLGNPWFGVLLSVALMSGAILWALQGWLPPGWALLGGVLAALRIAIVGDWINSYWGGAPAAIGGALLVGAYPRLVRSWRTSHALFLALGTAILANSRPLEGFVLFIPVLAAVTFKLLPKFRTQFPPLAQQVLLPLGLSFLLLLGFLGYYNWRVTTNPFVLPAKVAAHQYSNYPLFLFQKVGPPLHYRNAQFEAFYNETILNANPRSWSWSVLSKSHKIWGFFLGTTLAIPLIMVPSLLRDRRTGILVILFAVGFTAELTISWCFPHYFAPLTATIYILAVQLLRHLRFWEIRNKGVGLYLVRLVVVLALLRPVTVVAYSMQHPVHDWRNRREQVIRQLQSMPGKQLVLVSYRAKHTVEHEWVYNSADIDGSKIVWARVIPGRDLMPLIQYFGDRSVWWLEADASPPELRPFSANPQANSNFALSNDSSPKP